MYCDKTFRSERSLRTNENMHRRENLDSGDIFIFTSSFKRHQLYISSIDQGYITDIKEAVNYILDNIITYESYKYKYHF